MIYAVMQQAQRGKYPHPDKKPKEAQSLKELGELGHEIVETHNKSRHQCLLCGQSWPKKWCRMVLERGRCPGPDIWGGIQYNRPWMLPKGDILLGARPTHPTHGPMMWFKGILYCSKCGKYYAGKRSVQLVQECPRVPNGAGESF